MLIESLDSDITQRRPVPLGRIENEWDNRTHPDAFGDQLCRSDFAIKVDMAIGDFGGGFDEKKMASAQIRIQMSPSEVLTALVGARFHPFEIQSHSSIWYGSC